MSLKSQKSTINRPVFRQVPRSDDPGTQLTDIRRPTASCVPSKTARYPPKHSEPVAADSPHAPKRQAPHAAMETPESAAQQSDTGKQAACRQCRARKVKCDRTLPSCQACTRLKLPCSFSHQSASPEADVLDAAELTQAGTKRKRTRQACKACRVVKAKCSGGYPCVRCVNRGWMCDDNLAKGTTITDLGLASHITTSGSVNIPQTEDAMSMGDNTTPRTTTSTNQGGEAFLDRITIRGYLDAYFDTASRSAVAILHKPTVLADWNRGRLDRALLKTIVAIGRFKDSSEPEGQVVARVWMQEVQQDILKHLTRYTLTQLQVMVLLIRIRYQAGDHSDAWNLLPLAARLAFTMRLNYEQEDLEPVAQETRRRLIWAIYHLDRQFSGGIEDLSVCPPERVHVRLPCDDQTFQRGVQSRAGYLTDHDMQDGIGMDVFAFHLRIFVIRDRILRYTKRVRRMGSSPSSTYNEMQALQSELDRFEQMLPPELKLTPERLMLMVNSSEAVKYVGLHMHWMQCHCDLYRFCIPGIREAVSKDALARTPPDYVDFCQRACLDMALRLADLWSDTIRLEPSEATTDSFLPISIYQVAQICRHLQNLLPAEGRHSVVSLKDKLLDALKLAAPLEVLPGPRKCLKDAERVIMTLGGSSVGQSSRASSVGADDVGREHLVSRHALMPRVSRKQETSTEEEGEPPTFETYPRILATESGDDAARAMLDLANAGHVATTVEPVEDMMPWDPFDMQTNGYYDPELGDLLASMTGEQDYSLRFS